MRVNRDIAGIDIWRAAKLLVDQHSADAPVMATQPTNYAVNLKAGSRRNSAAGQ